MADECREAALERLELLSLKLVAELDEFDRMLHEKPREMTVGEKARMNLALEPFWEYDELIGPGNQDKVERARKRYMERF